MTDTILLAGATGMFGGRIAHHLLARADIRLRLLARDPASEKAKLELLVAAGAEVTQGDLADPASLDLATRGVDVIVSAVQGGPDVIVEGQIALAMAGRANGARRILPSDYALDLFKATPGEHAMFDMRALADARIAELGLEQVHVLQGAFMDMFLPGHGTIDLEGGTVSFWGDGERPIETTSVEDTARVVARIATDRTVAAGKFAIAGDRISFGDAGRIIAKLTGRRVEPARLGSEADLRAAMSDAEPEKKVGLAYLLYMTNGQTALDDLQNDRFPDIRFDSFAAFAARSLMAPK